MFFKRTHHLGLHEVNTWTEQASQENRKVLEVLEQLMDLEISSNSAQNSSMESPKKHVSGAQLFHTLSLRYSTLTCKSVVLEPQGEQNKRAVQFQID